MPPDRPFPLRVLCGEILISHEVSTAMILTDERRDAYLPLTESGVPKAALERLAALGITTLQELRDVWWFGNRQLLVDFLGDSPVRFAAFRPAGGFARGAAAGPGDLVDVLAMGNPPPLVRKPRGLALSAEQRHHRAEAPAPVPKARGRGETVVDLSAQFSPVRDQGGRGTCVAFASVACLEYHLHRGTARPRHHSEQFLFWACKQSPDDGVPDRDDTTLPAARAVMKSRGVCLAKTWPYDPIPGATAHQGPPPDGAEAEARSYAWGDAQAIPAGNVDGLRALLDAGTPVVLGVETYPSWDFPIVHDTGEVLMPLPGENPDGGHAVCVVGYERRGGVPGGGAFLFRNSWGRKWAGPHGRFAEGHGTLFFDYVRLYAVDAFC
jgi:hypothetical protein